MNYAMIPRIILHSPWPLVAVWWIGGALALFVPVMKWNRAKMPYYNAYGRYQEYENNQRAYEEAQNGNNNQNYNNQYNPSQMCNWWQFKCRQQVYYYRAMQQGGNENRQITPPWYQYLGGLHEEEDREAREQMGQSFDQASGPVKFVYTWSIIIFISLLLFGTYTTIKKKSFVFLGFALAVVLQYSLLMMLLLPQGVISTDDRDLEESVYGWYGQLGVLMVYFYYGQCLFAGIFLLIGGTVALIRTFVMAPKVVKEETTSEYQPASKLDIN